MEVKQYVDIEIRGSHDVLTQLPSEVEQRLNHG